MTTLVIEHFGGLTTTRENRVLRHARDQAADELAGRTVWCVTALPRRRPHAMALRDHLDWAGEHGVAADAPDVAAAEAARSLGERLDGMLTGESRESSRAPLGAADRELYADALREGEEWVRDNVRPDDVVVLHDPLTLALADAVRERGAHAVWHVALERMGAPGSVEALAFLRPHAAAVDAYVTSRRRPTGRGMRLEEVAAMMPAADLVAARDITVGRSGRYTSGSGPETSRDVCWSSVLTAVVQADRDECVGGTLHPRPTVAAR